ncbi:unnamed protein product [Rotaria sordida]|uniref:Uncharacterized protein n=1 Tax=Rotaria sordida TaxID=392033 RepID=A0A815AWC1_9BILA|nr:unnamed protein product [Rotaria sordida]CAF1261680.1 unnamed protein product [Rotaria sordida]
MNLKDKNRLILLTAGLHNIPSLCWPNTVKLTLSIQHASEVELLLQHNSLPSFKHLEVTNEDLHIVLPISNDK